MRFPYAQRHLLYAELAKMLRAGFGLDRSAETILSQNPPSVQRVYLEGLVRGLRSGASVTRSLELVAEQLPLGALELSIVEAGEKGGKLEQSFEHLSAYYEVLEQTRNRVRIQMIYPLILLHLAVILPAIPVAIVAGDTGVFVRHCVGGLAVLYIGSAVAAVVFRALSRAGGTGAAADAFLRRLPLVEKTRQQLALSRFCNVWHIYLLAAYPISKGLRAAGEAAQSGLLREKAVRIAEGVELGSPLGELLLDGDYRAFPEAFARSLGTASETGTLDEDLDRWSRHYRESSLEALQNAGAWFAKILYFGVVLFVIWQILSMGADYLDTLNGFLDMPT